MKKFIFIFVLLCSFINLVLAAEPSKLVVLTDRCNVVDDKEVTIHVEVMSTNDGIIAVLTDRFIIGRIINNDDMNISFNNIESNYTKQVILDSLKDENDRSNLNLYFDKDIHLKNGEKLITFNTNIKFNGDVPDSIYILGNEVLISDNELVCENVNGYKTEVIKTEVSIKKDMTIYYAIGGILLFVCIVEFVIIIVFKRNSF